MCMKYKIIYTSIVPLVTSKISSWQYILGIPLPTLLSKPVVGIMGMNLSKVGVM